MTDFWLRGVRAIRRAATLPALPPSRLRIGRRRAVGETLLVGLALGLAACQSQPAPPEPTPVEVVVVGATATAESPVVPMATPSATPTVRPTETVEPTPEATATPDPFARVSKAGEWTIEIPRIDIKAPIISVGLEPDGAIEAPSDPDVVGWFKGGAYPGKTGNAILDGHRDWYVGPRPAIFWDLGKVTAGARIFVYDDGDTHIYEVFRTVTYAFDDPDALETIQPADEPILTLITCDGAYNAATRNYGLRTIVQAKLRRSY